ncbi:hypothetical protein TCON_1882 [Astathelohania contejeani]|uniref:Uncharacterized protein n=1 Tax=Astathelohania contejeani TaxID=164912 RepID=A0ABQ7HXP2_9MICR|nr:hypothetical protein TCON_1882 [Thelohania contejeani]
MAVLIVAGNLELKRIEIINKIEKYIINNKLGNVKILEGEFKTIRSDLLNAPKDNTIFIINGSCLKSERYEMFCIARRFNTSYGVICVEHSDEISDIDDEEKPQKKNKYDNPLIFVNDEIDWNELMKILNKNLVTNMAHKKKKSPSESYWMELRNTLKEINQEFNIEGSESVVKECENRIFKMVNSNPVGNIGECYRTMLKDEFKKRGFLE